MSHSEFFKDNLPVDLTRMEQYFNSGFMYFYKRDKKLRPLLIIDLLKLINGRDFSFLYF